MHHVKIFLEIFLVLRNTRSGECGCRMVIIPTSSNIIKRRNTEEFTSKSSVVTEEKDVHCMHVYRRKLSNRGLSDLINIICCRYCHLNKDCLISSDLLKESSTLIWFFSDIRWYFQYNHRDPFCTRTFAF